ncbi:hypothetical protein Z043_117516 [Scleropages formosus]|uniref:Uncharacterized protein n=1 Tax=Scleropages formosus TaxID=113540 RepID=A0A0P7WKB0_SCLFO|nr:hypothetical protein Z043_117516 [Scleropages formosus]
MNGLLLQDNAVSAEIRALLSSYYSDSCDDSGTATDVLTRHPQESLLSSQSSAAPHWMFLFEEFAGHPSPQRMARVSPRCPQPGLLSSDASLSSESPSPFSVSPRSPRGRAESPSHFRPRTLSLDAKLSGLRGQAWAEGMRCTCQAASRSSVSRSPQMALSCSSSTSSSSSSSEGISSPFSRPSPARRSLRNLRTKLDPRNWLQSHRSGDESELESLPMCSCNALHGSLSRMQKWSDGGSDLGLALKQDSVGYALQARLHVPAAGSESTTLKVL